MKTLIIPDIHEDMRGLKKILAQAGPVDRRVFLGDWFDTFTPDEGQLTETIQFLRDSLANDTDTFLLGNHDLPYMYPLLLALRCSGNDMLKRIKMRQELEMLKVYGQLYTEVDGWTISHAGFSWRTNSGAEPNVLKEQVINRRLGLGLMSYYVGPGKARGGKYETGGLTWLDWDMEFEPVEEMKQIVGHSEHAVPQWKGQNLCLDTRRRHYAMIVDGIVTVCRVI